MTPAPHHSVFTGRMPFLPPNNQSTEGRNYHKKDQFKAISEYQIHRVLDAVVMFAGISGSDDSSKLQSLA